MADQIFNRSLGRVAEFYNRVDTNDPAASAIIIVILRTTNLEADAGLKDRDDLNDILVTGTSDEPTQAQYGRKTLTDTELVAFAPDDTNNRVDLDIPDQTWVAVVAGDAWSRFLTCYDNDTGAGTDANIVPMTSHDFVVTPDGSDITAQVAAAGFFRAS